MTGREENEMENPADRYVRGVVASLADEMVRMANGEMREIAGAMVLRRGTNYRVTLKRRVFRFNGTAVYNVAEDAAIAILLNRHIVVRTPPPWD